MLEVIFNNIKYDGGVLLPDVKSKEFSVEVRGHAGYGVKGKDIVCAAVSVLFHTLLVSISKIAQVPQDISDTEDSLSTRIVLKEISDGNLSVLKVLIDSFCVGIFELLKEYPENIDITFED